MAASTPVRPTVFVGSALEHRDLLSNLQRKNTHSRIRYVPWTNLDLFPPSQYTLPSLIACLSKMSGAVFLALSADQSWWRGSSVPTPRDNVTLEAGLAIGLLGLNRTVIVTDRAAHLPSDLAGMTTVLCSLTGNVSGDADDLHVNIESFFLAQGATELPPLSSLRPERFPEVTWERLALSFPEAKSERCKQVLAMIQTGRYAQAKRELEREGDLVGQYLAARVALLSGDRQEAKRAAWTLLEASLQSVIAGTVDAYHFFEIAARRLSKCFKEYDDVFERCQELARHYSPPDLHHLMGSIERHYGDFQEALVHYDRAVAAGSENIWTFVDKAECHYRLGQPERLWEMIVSVQMRWPDNINAECLYHYLEAISLHWRGEQ